MPLNVCWRMVTHWLLGTHYVDVVGHDDDGCQELTTLWVARLDDGAKLKVTDPEEQQGDIEEEETEDEERRERVDC